MGFTFFKIFKSKNYDPNINDGRKTPIIPRVSVAEVQDKYSSYPSNGLTPGRLAQIFKEADTGDVLRQMELFEEMEEKDPHLFSQLQTRKNAVTGLDYEVLSFSDDERDKEIAEFVKEQLNSIENFEDILIDLLDAIGKGIAFAEIMWDFDDGKTVISDINRIAQKKFFWDNMKDELKLMTKDYPSGIGIPLNKIIIHRYKARSGHPARAGVLRVVAWMYLFKNYDIKDWVSFCEVFGMPLRLGKYNQAASEEDKQALMQAIIQIGTDAAGIIPDGTQIDFIESLKTSSVNAYEDLARYCDEQISKAISGQTLTSDSGGSYAQSKTHNEVRHDLTAADCKALATTLKRDLIKPLVFYNFGEDKRIPTIRFDCEEASDLKETADIYNILINNIGLKIATSHIYKKFSIPKPEESEEIASPIQNGTETAYKTNILKSDDPITTPINENQKRIDDIVEASTKHSEKIFTEMFDPILKLVDNSQSLEEVKNILDDEAKVYELYKDMNVKDLDNLLEKGMFISNLLGRLIE